MTQLQPLPWLSMLHVLRNNLKNVLLTKTLEPGSESGHSRHNWSWSEPDVCPYFTLLTLANIRRQVTWSLVSRWSVADRDRDGVILCHLVQSIWQFDIDPVSPALQMLTTQLSCHGRTQIRKMSMQFVFFFRQKYLIQWSSFMWKRLIWNTWRVFRKMINTCGV